MICQQWCPKRLVAVRNKLEDSSQAAAGKVTTGQSKRASLAYKSTTGTLISRLKRHIHLFWYRNALRKPIDPKLALFSAFWGRSYTCNPRAIYEAANELIPGFRGVWAVRPGGQSSFPPGVKTVTMGTRAYFEIAAQAAVFVENAPTPGTVVKRPGAKFVQTHHGTPLKLMGEDRIGTTSGKHIKLEKSAVRVERWDYCISSNPHSSAAWKTAYPGKYTTLETGYPRNDLLVTATDDDRQKWRAELGIGADQKVILYAPTLREYSQAYLQFLDISKLASALGDAWTILNRKHYSYEPGDEPASSGGAQVIDVSSHPSIERLCVASDLLVTDYSSVMFDYAIQSKPIVIYAPDWERYIESRGVYFDLLAEPPGPAAQTEEDLTAALCSGAPWTDASIEALERFRSKFCSWEKGDAARQVVEKVWGLNPATSA